MGEVYLARQRGAAGFQKLLVVKTLLPHLCEDDEFIHMFQDEARITAQLVHPNICQTFEFDKLDGTWFLAMEYLHGEDVRRLWKAAAAAGLEVPVPLICRIMSDAAAGLDFAHDLLDDRGQPYGIVHRDISPQNILVTFEGGVKIIDFGVAKAQGRLTQTRTGALKGKYSYMSPEQVNGENVDRRTDIFALGIVMHELLTSTRLFKADSDVSTIERVKRAPIPAPSELNPKLPKGLDAIVLKALDRDVEKRFQTAGQLRLALEDWLVQERMSASSAHLAGFLKRVYKERLELEARTGPMLGESEPQALPIGAPRAISRSDVQRLENRTTDEGLPFALDPLPEKGQRAAGADSTRNERSNERTPSQPGRGTNPGREEPDSQSQSRRSVIDLSMIMTESTAGPFRGRKGLRNALALALGLVIVVGTVVWLARSSRPGAPASAASIASSGAVHGRIVVVTDPPNAALAVEGQPVAVGRWESPERPACNPSASASEGECRPLHVVATLDGYLPASADLIVLAGVREHKLRLNAAPLSILLKSDPEDAEVSEGARVLGRTPFNWTADRGPHKLVFRRAGYRDLEHELNLTGSERDLAVRLLREAPRGHHHNTDAQQPPTTDQAIKLER